MWCDGGVLVMCGVVGGCWGGDVRGDEGWGLLGCGGGSDRGSRGWGRGGERGGRSGGGVVRL